MGRVIRRALALSFVALVFATGAKAEPTHYYDHTVTLGRIPVFAGTDTFAAPDGRTGRLTLKVTGRVEGFVTFNNAVVAAPRDLVPGATIVRTVPLLATNRISAALAGRQGGSIRGYVTLAPEAGQMINAATGGCIEVTAATSPIKGAGICVPAGALSQNTTIEIFHPTDSIPPLDINLLPASEPVQFEPAGLQFNSDAETYLPFYASLVPQVDGDYPQLFLIGQEADGSLFDGVMTSVDSNSAKITASLLSFTTYQAYQYPTAKTIIDMKTRAYVMSDRTNYRGIPIDLNQDNIGDLVLLEQDYYEPALRRLTVVTRVGCGSVAPDQPAGCVPGNGLANGRFGDETKYSVPGLPIAYTKPFPKTLLVSDVDADGYFDVILNYDEVGYGYIPYADLVVYLGCGNTPVKSGCGVSNTPGTFASPAVYRYKSNYPFDNYDDPASGPSVAADVNGDNIIDIVSPPHVIPGCGRSGPNVPAGCAPGAGVANGTFGAPQFIPVTGGRRSYNKLLAGDFNNDGITDITYGIGFFWGCGANGISKPVPPLCTPGSGVANGQFGASLINYPATYIAPISTYLPDYDVKDLNNDSIPDFVVIPSNASVKVAWGCGASNPPPGCAAGAGMPTGNYVWSTMSTILAISGNILGGNVYGNATYGGGINGRVRISDQNLDGIPDIVITAANVATSSTGYITYGAVVTYPQCGLAPWITGCPTAPVMNQGVPNGIFASAAFTGVPIGGFPTYYPPYPDRVIASYTNGAVPIRLEVDDLNDDQCEDIFTGDQLYPVTGNVINIYLKTAASCHQPVIITDFFASPPTINSGQSSDLTWTTANADTCTITSVPAGTNYSIPTGDLPAGPPYNVTPTVTTEYHLHCTGANGSFDDAYATVMVNTVVDLSTCGQLQWARHVASFYGDEIRKVITLTNGNTLLVGNYLHELYYGPASMEANVLSSTVPYTYSSYVLNIDSSGNVNWVKPIDGANYSILVNAIQLSDGTIVVFGGANRPVTFARGEVNETVFNPPNSAAGYIFAAKYDVTGNFMSVERISTVYLYAPTPDGGFVTAGNFYALTDIYANGVIAATASQNNSTYPANSDILTIKYNSSGGVDWYRVEGGPEDDQINGIDISPSGDIFTTGIFRSGMTFGLGTANPITVNPTVTGGFDGYVAGYDSSGTPLFVNQYSYGTGNDIKYSTIDDTVVASGTFGYSYPILDYLVKIDMNGNQVFSRSNTGYFQGHLAISSNGNIVVAGMSSSTPGFTFDSGSPDALAIPAYSRSGQSFVVETDIQGRAIWGKFTDVNYNDQMSLMSVAPNGDIYDGLYSGTPVIFGLGEPNEVGMWPFAATVDGFLIKMKGCQLP